MNGWPARSLASSFLAGRHDVDNVGVVVVDVSIRVGVFWKIEV